LLILEFSRPYFLSPDRDPIITDASFTNHQETIDWPENAKFCKTIERSNFGKSIKKTFLQVSDAFLRPPLCTTFEHGFALYTAVYNPIEGTVCTDGHMRKY
jgi:hypothetical protein